MCHFISTLEMLLKSATMEQLPSQCHRHTTLHAGIDFDTPYGLQGVEHLSFF